jgi:hypothetical protein
MWWGDIGRAFGKTKSRIVVGLMRWELYLVEEMMVDREQRRSRRGQSTVSLICVMVARMNRKLDRLGLQFMTQANIVLLVFCR